LKATTLVFSNEVCSTYTAMSSRTLLSNHICYLTLFECYVDSTRICCFQLNGAESFLRLHSAAPEILSLLWAWKVTLFYACKRDRILEGSFRERIFHTCLKLTFTAVHMKFALVMELLKIFIIATVLVQIFTSLKLNHLQYHQGRY